MKYEDENITLTLIRRSHDFFVIQSNGTSMAVFDKRSSAIKAFRMQVIELMNEAIEICAEINGDMA